MNGKIKTAEAKVNWYVSYYYYNNNVVTGGALMKNAGVKYHQCPNKTTFLL